MEKKIKILRVFSRLNIGGPSLHVINLTQGLSRLNYECILCVGSEHSWEGDMSNYAEQMGVSPITIFEFQPAINPFKDVIAFIKLLMLIIKTKPDIVHTHTSKAGALGRVAAKILRTKLIVHTYHGHLLHGYGSPLKSKIWSIAERILNLFTDECIAVSKTVADDLIHSKVVPSRKMNVIELGFNLDYLDLLSNAQSNLRNSLNLKQNDIIIASAGRLVPVKGFDLFLNSCIPLLMANINYHCVLIGEGPLAEDLKDLATLLTKNHQQLRKQIHFVGWLPELPKQLSDIDLYVCSSLNEGTSVAVIEAVINKVPVISTAVGGMPDLLENGKWGELTSRDANDLSQAMQRVLDKKESSEFKNFLALASQHFRFRFSTQRLCAEMDSLYQRHFGSRKI